MTSLPSEPATAELDRPGQLPEREALDDVLGGTASPQVAARELLGERLLWWKCCSEAVRADPAWLVGGRGEEVRAWLDATIADPGRSLAASVEHAWSLSRALSAPEGPSQERDEAVAHLVQGWARSGLVSPDATTAFSEPSGPGLARLSPRVVAGLRAVLAHVRDLGEPNGPRNMLVIAALLMAGVEPRRRPVIRVPVVLGRSAGPTGHVTSQEGGTGVLELRELRSGPTGLYPDPQTMAGVRSSDGQFTASLGHAWKASGPRREGRCVLWRLVMADETVPLARIDGPSLGVAFALGLRELLRHPPSARPSPVGIRRVFYGLRPRTAVTGALDGGEGILRVTGMDAKLTAARRAGLWLVVPEANRLDVAAAPETGEVQFAANLGQADRYARRFRTRRVVVAALALIAVVSGLLAVQQREEARSAQEAAVAGRLVAAANQLRATDPSLAAQLDLLAYRMTPDPNPYTNLVADGNAILSAPLDAHDMLVSSVAYRPDGQVLATASQDGIIKLWSLADPVHPTLLGEPLANVHLIFDVVFSPDGRILASGGYDGKVRLWNVTDPARAIPLGESLNVTDAILQSVAFSPDGRTLATGADDGTIRLWDIADPAHPTVLSRSLPGKTGYVVKLAFTSDGRALAASGNDFTVRLWDLTDPTQEPTLLQPSNPVNAVYDLALSPDGRTLAASNDGSVWLWDIGDPAHPFLLPYYLPTPSRSTSSASLAFSPDGRILAVGDNEHRISLWNVSDPAAPVGLPSRLTAGSDVHALAFSPNGRTLTGGAGDGRVRIWSLPDHHLPGPATSVDAVAFSPDGRLLATADDAGTATLWDITDPADLMALGRAQAGTRPIYNLMFSADGRVLITGDLDGTVKLWDVTDPADPEAVGQILSAATGGGDLALSLDGRTLAAGRGSHTIEVWSLADPAQPRSVGQPVNDTNLIDSFAISPDGRTIATFGGGATVKLWDATRPADPVMLGDIGPLARIPEPLAFGPDGRTLAASSGAVTYLWNVVDPARPASLGASAGSSSVASLAFSPVGGVLVAGSEDGAVRFIDPSRPTDPTQPLIDHAGSVFALAFSSDGRTLASVAADRTVRLWNMDPDAAAQWICATTVNLTTTQWERYLPEVPYDPPCSG